MTSWTDFLTFANSFSLTDYLVICINIVLIVSARPLVAALSPKSWTEKSLALRIAILRGINLVVIASYVYYLMASHGITNTLLGKAAGVIGAVYFGYLINYIAQYVIFRGYGKQRTINGKTAYVETYRTRALGLLASMVVGLITIVAIVRQMGFDSMLEAGGVLGVLGVMIGLTQGAWAPDIISGLILLNSDIFEEGDMVEIDNHSVGLVYKVKMFHTELLNVMNNHRIMIRNAKMRDLTIHNLSKFASARGLRECLKFNIGYDVAPDKVRKLFEEVTQKAIQDGIAFEHSVETETRLLDTGDHALQWGFIYYVKNVAELISIRRDMRLLILKTANKNGISLATPLTHTAQLTRRASGSSAQAELSGPHPPAHRERKQRRDAGLGKDQPKPQPQKKLEKPTQKPQLP